MISKKTGSIISAAVLLTALWSCGSNKTADNNTDVKNDTAAVKEDTTEEVQENDNGKTYLLPSPLQIAYIFKKSGLKYVAGTTHDVKKQNDYSTSYSQSLALGIYSSDLAYCVLNKEKQDAINY